MRTAMAFVVLAGSLTGAGGSLFRRGDVVSMAQLGDAEWVDQLIGRDAVREATEEEAGLSHVEIKTGTADSASLETKLAAVLADNARLQALVDELRMERDKLSARLQADVAKAAAAGADAEKTGDKPKK